jgi:S-methyl-5-thioribose-1-phosphate isomerase
MKAYDLRPIFWDENKKSVVLLDVSRIPWEERYIETKDYERIAQAIERLEVRGAPAIGIAAALGLVVAAYSSNAKTIEDLVRDVRKAAERLRRTRPTAYNLFWALSRMSRKLEELIAEVKTIEEVKEGLKEEAIKMINEDIENNKRMGEYGSTLIDDGDVILTHCNTGSLATAGYGTALAAIRSAWLKGKNIKVIATETRPLLQGARLTIWELMKDGIPVKLITDGMIASAFKEFKISKVFVGADRILLDGHVANKIGTFTIAIVSNYFGSDFNVVAPTSTIDPTDVDKIVIEMRNPEEVRTVMGKIAITLENVEVYNPAFDITPPELINAIVTENGIARKPFKESLARLLKTH